MLSLEGPQQRKRGVEEGPLFPKEGERACGENLEGHRQPVWGRRGEQAPKRRRGASRKPGYSQDTRPQGSSRGRSGNRNRNSGHSSSSHSSSQGTTTSTTVRQQPASASARPGPGPAAALPPDGLLVLLQACEGSQAANGGLSPQLGGEADSAYRQPPPQQQQPFTGGEQLTLSKMLALLRELQQHQQQPQEAGRQAQQRRWAALLGSGTMPGSGRHGMQASAGSGMAPERMVSALRALTAITALAQRSIPAFGRQEPWHTAPATPLQSSPLVASPRLPPPPMAPGTHIGMAPCLQQAPPQLSASSLLSVATAAAASGSGGLAASPTSRAFGPAIVITGAASSMPLGCQQAMGMQHLAPAAVGVQARQYSAASDLQPFHAATLDALGPPHAALAPYSPRGEAPGVHHHAFFPNPWWHSPAQPAPAPVLDMPAPLAQPAGLGRQPSFRRWHSMQERATSSLSPARTFRRWRSLNDRSTEPPGATAYSAAGSAGDESLAAAASEWGSAAAAAPPPTTAAAYAAAPPQHGAPAESQARAQQRHDMLTLAALVEQQRHWQQMQRLQAIRSQQPPHM